MKPKGEEESSPFYKYLYQPLWLAALWSTLSLSKDNRIRQNRSLRKGSDFKGQRKVREVLAPSLSFGLPHRLNLLGFFLVFWEDHKGRMRFFIKPPTREIKRTVSWGLKLLYGVKTTWSSWVILSNHKIGQHYYAY